MVCKSGFDRYISKKVVKLICFVVNFYDKTVVYPVLDVLTLFTPKRSIYCLLLLLPVLIACGDHTQEISGTYETTISTASDFVTDSLVSAELPLADSLAAGQQASASDSSDAASVNPGLSSPGSSNPGLSSPGRTLSLELHEDQRAALKTTFLNDAPLVVQKGSWALVENERVRAYFVEKDGKFFKDTLTFYRDGPRLVLRGKSESIADEISLIKME